MGSHSIEAVWPGTLTPSEVRTKFDQLLQDDRHEHGHGGYSGSWGTMSGLTIKDTVFDTEKEAMQFCLDNTHKWDHALAVKFYRVTKSLKKAPTFGGKAPGSYYADNPEPIYTVTYGSGNGKTRIWADQLSTRQMLAASKVLAEYDRVLTEARTVHNRIEEFRRALTQPGDIDFRALRNTRKEYFKVNARCQTAKERWQALEASLRPKLWASTEKKDLCWLIAGWAAS